MGKRTGEWKIISQNSVLYFIINNPFRGGGSYDTNGLKNGKWTQLKDILQGGVLILEIGEYQNGIKTGLWIVKWVEILTKNNKIIGSGNYDNMGIKQGMWQDLIEDFCEQNQLIYKGAYKDGIRIDEWVIQSSKDFPKFCHISQTRTKVRGSGQYDQKGRKIGQWNEPCKNYQQF
ncbi:unnamed protein product (macronuclear) [Paramecium tetraurelia]|uniref:Calpain catalytic domain-containing protein n=1 Tax=Paramecium tetraurelia TaxID=5888 RepID=A0C2J9_PARTE|nr:uncharacterized protein GSPATT00034494001 [Paramecium tetraurelia]CAK65016.1 unnamed protein product [Paramecium tetraurelia]|eukprot:XP_001432413.1 hypothetical protein (macronuclear) [Paramecium tetraurelia strain d4-2]